MQGYIDLLDIDLKHGARALATFDAAGPCGKDCWPRIIDYFFASQWIDVTTDPIVYGEIQRTGLPRDANLKSVITRYYGLQNQIASILVVLPAYRERVRSIIPAAAQAHIWRVCFRAEGRRQFFDETCPSPVNDDEARAIFDALHNDVELRGMLNYWLSTVSLVRITLGQQIVEANKTVAAIDDHLGTHP